MLCLAQSSSGENMPTNRPKRPRARTQLGKLIVDHYPVGEVEEERPVEPIPATNDYRRSARNDPSRAVQHPSKSQFLEVSSWGAVSGQRKGSGV